MGGLLQLVAVTVAALAALAFVVVRVVRSGRPAAFPGAAPAACRGCPALAGRRTPARRRL